MIICGLVTGSNDFLSGLDTSGIMSNDVQICRKKECIMKKDKSFESQVYEKARGNLLLMIILTVINIALFFMGSETIMLFSATVPYMSIIVGCLSEIDVVMQVCAIFTVAIILMYLLCWIFSKRNPIWIIIAMVMFIIDTIAVICVYLDMQDASGLLDLGIHIWVLYYLFTGIKYGYKFKKINSSVEKTDTAIDNETEITKDTSALYRAEMDVKHRVLAETDAHGYHVCYRRVKRRNELVVNGYVYDIAEMLIEPPHKLTASIDEHLFEVGYDGFRSYIRIDGEILVKKIRIW